MMMMMMLTWPDASRATSTCGVYCETFETWSLARIYIYIYIYIYTHTHKYTYVYIFKHIHESNDNNNAPLACTIIVVVVVLETFETPASAGGW